MQSKTDNTKVNQQEKQECYQKIKDVISDLILVDIEEYNINEICDYLYTKARSDCDHLTHGQEKDWIIYPKSSISNFQPVQWMLTRRYIIMNILDTYYNESIQTSVSWLYSKKRLDLLFQKVLTSRLKPYLLTWNNNLSSNEIYTYSQAIWNRFLLHNNVSTSKKRWNEKKQQRPLLKLYHLTERYVHVIASVLHSNYEKYGKAEKKFLPKQNTVNKNVWKIYIESVMDTSSAVRKMTPYNNNAIDIAEKVWNRLRANTVILGVKGISISGNFEKVICSILEDLEEDCSLLSSINSVSCSRVKLRMNSMLPYLNSENNGNDDNNNRPRKIRKVVKVRIKLKQH